jgi:hypothetical protein
MTIHSFGFDDNLGLPAKFSAYAGVNLKSYHELGEMVEDFEKQNLSMMFIPCGTLPYLTKFYTIIAQATLGRDYNTFINVKLVTAQDLSLEQSVKNSFGRINPYCTTSYWGLLLFLMEHYPSAKTIHFIQTEGFQDLLLKTHQKAFGCGMLWDKVLEQNPLITKELKVLGEKSNLPTPVIVANTAVDSALIHRLTHFRFEEKNGFFNGFTRPNLSFINSFLEQMKKALIHFISE